MKRFLTVMAVGVIGAFILVACGGDKKPAETGGTAGSGSAMPEASSAPASTAAAP